MSREEAVLEAMCCPQACCGVWHPAPPPFHHSLLPMGLQYTQYTSQLAPETLVLGDGVSVPNTNLAPACWVTRNKCPWGWGLSPPPGGLTLSTKVQELRDGGALLWGCFQQWWCS